MRNRSHITGPSGAGTTTIAKAICEKTGYRHFDSDDYFWLPADEPYTVQRPPEERLRMLARDLRSREQWTITTFG